MNAVSRNIVLRDSSQIGEARRLAVVMGESSHFSKTRSGELAIIVTELATNIIKHAGSGELIFRELPGNGIEVLALNQNKGMNDINQCMEDGYSTAGSPGTGLGAIKRLATLFDIYSMPEKGVAILAQLWNERPKAEGVMTLGAICLPYPGETVCGDSWSVIENEDATSVMMVDGLGHGSFAYEAAIAAREVFSKAFRLAPLALIHELNGALRSTRGAAALVVKIREGTLYFAGVGNISGFVMGGEKDRGLASYNGTLGHQMHKTKEMALPWAQNGLLILCSDGLTSRWKLEDYRGLRHSHPALIAGVLYRDFRRGRDDVTVLVMAA